jgi:hypothetical protein
MMVEWEMGYLGRGREGGYLEYERDDVKYRKKAVRNMQHDMHPLLNQQVSLSGKAYGKRKRQGVGYLYEDAKASNSSEGNGNPTRKRPTATFRRSAPIYTAICFVFDGSWGFFHVRKDSFCRLPLAGNWMRES